MPFSPFRARSPSSGRHRDTRHAASEPWSAGLARPFRGAPGEGARFVVFVLLLALVALCGGSSWPNVWPLLVLRPGAVLLATTILVLPGAVAPTLRVPGLLLAALALTIVVQLVPLPPALWTALPGHARYLEAAAAAGTGQPWRPVTVSIDLTLNSLVALAVPAAVLVGAAGLRADQRTATAGLLVAVAVASALTGLLQVTVGFPYVFALVSDGRPAGLFANINHQAALLAAAIPVAAAWGVSARGPAPVRGLSSSAAGMLLLATVLVAGSRGGLLLAALAVLSVPLVMGDRVRLASRTRRLVAAGLVVAAVVLVALVWAAGQLAGFDRLLREGTDQRVTFLPLTLGLLRAFAPFGSGFGTFDAVFRQIEPDDALRLTYFNHAHNDLLELGITGGVAAVAVTVVYLVWLARRGVATFGAERRTPTAPLARAGVVAALILLLASLADYPLRTPLAGAMLALASLWAADRGTRGPE